MAIKAVIAIGLFRALINRILNIVRDILGLRSRAEQIRAELQSTLALTESWQDDAAEAFRNDVTNNLIPQVDRLIALLGGCANGLENACAVVEDTDKKAVCHADDLGEAFRRITQCLGR